MVSIRQPRPLAFEDYLLVDAASGERNEFIAGAIYAMAGGSVRHALIAANVLGTLRSLLANGACRPVGSDMRLFVEAAQIATYPDVAVYCGRIETWKGREDVATNPSAIFEVLSPSTAAYDRGEKFEAYKQLPSLKDYVLVATDHIAVELFSRSPDGVWVPSMTRGIDAKLALPSLGVHLPLADVYAHVDVEPR